jgi:rubredoxin
LMPPKRKTLPASSPDILKKLIPEALAIKYQGLVYDEARPCPRCGCEAVTRYDMEDRTFCTTIVDGSFEPIDARVKRFRCSRCRSVFEGKAPFYDGCNNASPIVDLCRALAASNPYNRVESILMNYGIQVDRDTVRNYAIRFRDRAAKYSGIPVMDDAKIGMNVLKILFDVEDVEELRKRYPGKYDALMDETYPRAKGAKKALAEQRYAKRVTGEKQPRFPDSFTLVSSYLDNLKCFASISCRGSPFNGIVASALAKPLRGADAIITDGSECYDGIRDYRCLFHKMRNFSAVDPFLQRVRQSKEKLIPPWLISEYMQEIYAFAEGEYEPWLKERYPSLVDEQTGEYVGAMTTNSMEGGNWRLKYELRAAYQKDESIEARCLLVALRDSMKTFRNGRPEASFASMNSKFGYDRIMGATAKNDHGVGSVIETAVRAAA